MASTQDHDGGWCARLYAERAAGLVLCGRSLGLSHSEAEDVVQETFLASVGLASPPEQPGHYCLRAFRNRALNFRRCRGGGWRGSSSWRGGLSGSRSNRRRSARQCAAWRGCLWRSGR